MNAPPPGPATQGPLRALLVEDSVDDAELIVRALERAGLEPISQRVECRPKLRGALEREQWDVVLSDHVLPGFSSHAALAEVRHSAPATPFIVVSGRIGEEAAVELMQQGAWGFLAKESLGRLGPLIQRALRERAAEIARAEAERRLIESTAQLRGVFENALDAMVIADGAGIFLEVNDAACEAFERSRTALIGACWADFLEPERPEDRARRRQRFLEQGALRGEVSLRLPDGRLKEFDYAAKANIVPGHHLSVLREVTERNAAVRALERSRAGLAEAQRLARLGSWEWDSESDSLVVSAEGLRLLGIESRDAAPTTLEQGLALVVEADRPRARRLVEAAARDGLPSEYELRAIRVDGEIRAIRGQIHLRETDADGRCVTGVFQDITEWRAAEDQRALLERKLAQAQRLESVGQLAGGIAHDFNNLLAVIINYAHFAEEQIGDHPAVEDLAAVREAARQAADLTRQLLVFSRADPTRPRVLQLNELLAASGRLLSRTLGEQVTIELDTADALWPVRADKAQLEQVILNLAVNARDAMAGSGSLTFSTANLELERSSVETGSLEPGPYVVLRAADSGCGMSPDVAERAFDPFFTTKAKGGGSGLGLATVYGVVVDAGGHIAIRSTPGAGTEISIYLPALPGSALEPMPEGDGPGRRGRARGEKVLLVEDETAVRELTERILSTHGYEVAATASAEEALAVVGDEPPDVVLTDVVMPGLSGAELAEQLRARWPRLEVVFTSGYTNRPGELPLNRRFLPKPFSREQLLGELERALTATARDG